MCLLLRSFDKAAVLENKLMDNVVGFNLCCCIVEYAEST